jgi:hypothetical protein
MSIDSKDLVCRAQVSVCSYPNTYDVFTNPISGDTLEAVPHHTQHTKVNDVLFALERRVGLNPIIYTNTFTVTESDTTCIANKSTAMTVNIPAAIGSGRLLHIKNIGLGNVTIEGNGSNTIDGELTQTLYQWEAIIIQDYGSGVWIVF